MNKNQMKMMEVLCDEFLVELQRKWNASRKSLEQSGNTVGMMEFLDNDLSRIGLSGEFTLDGSPWESFIKDGYEQIESVAFVCSIMGNNSMEAYRKRMKEMYASPNSNCVYDELCPELESAKCLFVHFILNYSEILMENQKFRRKMT